MDIWKKSDWREKPRVQMPDYQNTKVLHDVEAQLSKYPPLVFAGEARSLKQQLGDVANGKGFLLQGGDCAESFEEFSADNIRDTFRVANGSCPNLRGEVPCNKSWPDGRAIR